MRTNVPEDDFTNEIFSLVEKNKKDEQFRSEYMRCNLHDYDIMEEGIVIGEKRGEERAKLEAARNMILENDSLDKISRCLTLPLETVQRLAKDITGSN